MKNYSLPTSSSNIRQPVAFRGAGGGGWWENYSFIIAVRQIQRLRWRPSTLPFSSQAFFSLSPRVFTWFCGDRRRPYPGVYKNHSRLDLIHLEPGWNITAKALSIFLILFPHVCHGPSAIVPLWQFFWCSLQLLLAFCCGSSKAKESWQILFVQIFYF